MCIVYRVFVLIFCISNSRMILHNNLRIKKTLKELVAVSSNEPILISIWCVFLLFYLLMDLIISSFRADVHLFQFEISTMLSHWRYWILWNSFVVVYDVVNVTIQLKARYKQINGAQNTPVNDRKFIFLPLLHFDSILLMTKGYLMIHNTWAIIINEY